MKVRTIIAVGAAAAALTATAAVPALASTHESTGNKIGFLITESTVGHKATGAVVLHGAVTAAGRDTSPEQGDFDVLHFSKGTLRVTHPNKDSKFSIKPNPKTCFYTLKITGTATFGHGTGKYKGYTGSATYKAQGQGVSARKKNGSCNFRADAVGSATVITGTGTLQAST